jgi:hypothetical protein
VLGVGWVEVWGGARWKKGECDEELEMEVVWVRRRRMRGRGRGEEQKRL